VAPLAFLPGEENRIDSGKELSDSMTAQAPPHIVDRLDETIFDRNQYWRFAPIIKRTSIDLVPKPRVLRIDAPNL
jgi:hypothetical protein